MTDLTRTELFDLLEALCEDRITDTQHARIEELVLADAGARQLYVEYVGLHGMLYWDAAAAARITVPDTVATAHAATASGIGRRRIAIISTAAACLIAAVTLLITWPGDGQQLVDVDPQESIRPGESTPLETDIDIGPPIQLTHDNSVSGPESNDPPEVPMAAVESRDAFSDQNLVEFIDGQIATVWSETGIEPSPRADDAEWLRRVYLDLAGHIPAPGVTEEFLADENPNKRAELVERLLDDPAYARHFASVWTNELVGRTPDQPIDRPALEEFLRAQFAGNRGWDETVTELIAAEGTSHESGATNFLLAHLNNEAVPATAVTARVFLGMQVQCTQCHKHPFYEQWGQDQFWELNAFFKQTDVVRHMTTDENGRSTVSHLELVSRETGGPTLYEDRNGVMKVALPEFDGQEVDPGPETNRRAELARLLTGGDTTQLAAAFVNRLWAHFFGYGFTNPVDDMGPHHPPTHPQLLAALSDEFVRSGFDVNRLIVWITSSEAYHLTSRAHEGNRVDNPELGDPAYFSRMYVKPLSAEQLFDSLLVATQVDRAGASLSEAVDVRRREWLEQFFQTVDTEENSELTTLDGTLPQALMMMNGDLVQQAVSGAPGTYLGEVLLDPSLETDEKIRRVSLATLSRYPTDDELDAIRVLLRNNIRAQTRRGIAPSAATNEALRDVFWAYLNSSEFAVNH